MMMMITFGKSKTSGNRKPHDNRNYYPRGSSGGSSGVSSSTQPVSSEVVSHYVSENNPTQIHRDVYSMSYTSTNPPDIASSSLASNGHHQHNNSHMSHPGDRNSSNSSGSTPSGHNLHNHNTSSGGPSGNHLGPAIGSSASGSISSSSPHPAVPPKGLGSSSGENSSQQNNVSQNNSNSSLISRSTQQTKTSSTKTITKTIRETRYLGPDGLPIDPSTVNSFNPYGTIEGHADYGAVNRDAIEYNNHSASQLASGANITYQNQQQIQQQMAAGNFNNSGIEYHTYQDYPLNPSTPPSVMSDSPPPMRRGSGPVMNHHMSSGSTGLPNHHMMQSGYDELDQTSVQYSNNPYGYIGAHQGSAAAAAALFDPYGTAASVQQPPSGYLDSRPSYDEHGLYQGNLSMTGGNFGDVDPHMMSASGGIVAPVPSGGQIGWRDPDLHEVIEFLQHPDAVRRANAAAYLQHLCFMDDNKKQQTRILGGIPPLVSLLTQDLPEIQKNACGALRNLSYGRKNDENKRGIKSCNGIPSLVRLLRTQPDNHELSELATGVLWNLSSCEDLKRPILDDCVSVLVKQIVIPASGWDINNAYGNPLTCVLNGSSGVNHMLSNGGIEPMYWSNLFKNSSGVLRNVSSAGEYARRKLRETPGFIESLVFLVRTAISKNDMDNKSIENCVCILRNLSYRCQEIIDPNYDSNPNVPGSPSHHNHHNHNSSLSPTSSRAAALMGSVSSKIVGENLGCFGGSKKNKHKESSGAGGQPSSSASADHLSTATGNLSISRGGQNGGPNHSLSGLLSQSTLPRNPGQHRILTTGGSDANNPKGADLLWQPEIVQPYLALLSGCSNPETLEASAGAIQNLSACYWQASIDIRAAVRKEKGLPVLVELLRMEVDRVVCAVATALRNLAMDSRNKELIGKYAMKDLVSKLPNGNHQHDFGTSDDTIAAVLATLNEVISKNADFAKSLLEAGGMDRLLFIIKNKNNKFSPRVFKFTSQLLFNMWQHLELRDVYRKAGYKETHFILRPASVSKSSGASQAAAATAASANHNNSSVGHNTSGNSSVNYANNTLSRPMSTQSATRYEDRTLPRGGGRQIQQQILQHQQRVS